LGLDGGQVTDSADVGALAPSSVPWPPIVFGSAAIAAVGIGRAMPARQRLPVSVRALGGAALVAGLGLDVAAMATMHRHRANILPHRPATALVTSGPFALTRNPIYLGNTLALAGAGLLFSNPWLLVGAACAARAVTGLLIAPEERHLAARFGADWVAYARHVPRWLGSGSRTMP
jgi:protein-S-isoprenylcysteine O-methyltransferase Ste14